MPELKQWLTFRPWRRHSLVLLIGGLVYIAFGIALITTSDNISLERQLALIVAIRIFPVDMWGAIFAAAGILACISARWPEFSESWGYAVLCGSSAAWSTVFLTGYLISDSPVTNMNSALVWALVAFIWWAISGLENPDAHRKGHHEPY